MSAGQPASFRENLAKTEPTPTEISGPLAISAADLLLRDDPGPPPALIEPLLLEREVTAVIGKHKSAKTWLILEMAIAIVSGVDALRRFRVPNTGPVLLILEESGQRALHRRLSMLSRGHGIDAESLRDLHVAANRRIRLDQSEGRERLMTEASRINPVAIFLDPIVRLKGDADENSQAEMAPILNYMRDLREEIGASVVFVHHTGHKETERMRGSSDFEAYWETRIRVERKKDDTVTLTTEHREAEADAPVIFRLDYEPADESIRLQPIDRDTENEMRVELLDYVEANPSMTGKDISVGVNRAKAATLERLKALRDKAYEGRTLRQIEEDRKDTAGRPYTAHVWKVEPWSQGGLPHLGDHVGSERSEPTSPDEGSESARTNGNPRPSAAEKAPGNAGNIP